MAMSLAVAGALAEGEEHTLEWLRGRSRHVPARPDDSVVIECKVFGEEWGRCEIEIILKELILGDEALTILEQVEKDHPKPGKGRQYVLARFYISMLAKEGNKLFHVDNGLFNVVRENGIAYTKHFALKKLSPSIVADLQEGVEYEGWVCFKVSTDDNPVAVFGRKWGTEAYFALTPEGGEAGADVVAYKGQLRSKAWIANKHKVHRRNYAFADGLFVTIDSIPVRGRPGSRFARPRQPGDEAPTIDEIKMRFGRKKSAKAGEVSKGLIQKSDRISRFEAVGDWGWIKGNVFQILGREEMLVEADGKTFYIGEYTTEGIIDGSPFEGWADAVGTYRYFTVKGASRTVWDCRVTNVEYDYPITLDQFKQLLRAGVELYRWEGTGERCPGCRGYGTVLVKETVTHIIGNIINRRTVTEVIEKSVKCPRCEGAGYLNRTWKKVKDY